jgi:capsular exopolysaccharide synthesis family protein
MKHINNTQELTVKEILNILNNYKWSIFFTTLLVTSLSYLITYFKPSIYVSSAIIKVKGNEKRHSNDVINNTLSTNRSKDVHEEITLLKTYRVNKNSLEKVNFHVKYFYEEAYKKIELYNQNVPIKINNLKIIDNQILNKYITIIPNGSGYDLLYKKPYETKIKQILFDTKEIEFKTLKNLNFGDRISTPYFTFSIEKVFEITNNIDFTLHGEKRNIFENIIRENLSITQLEKDTSLIQIDFEDSIPERANLYVNSLTESFINYSIENKNTQNDKTLDFITKELRNIKQELKDSEQQLESHQMNRNIVKPSIQADLYIKKLSSIEIKISENKLKKKLITNLINFVQNNYNMTAIAPSVDKLNDQNTLSLITKLQDKQLEEEELIQEYTDEYPKLKTLRNQISTIIIKIENNLKSLQTNIDYQNKNLLQRKNEYEIEMKTLPSKERELVNIRRNYEVKSKMYEYLLKKQAENKIIQLATYSNYQVIDKAYNSKIPIQPKHLFSIILGLILGLLLGSVLALVRHGKNIYIKNKEDINTLTNLPLYGSIPYYKQKKNKITIHKELKSPFSEAFRTLRTNLQFVSQKNEGTIILITSTIAGEGKSTSTANLATILEMARYKTIVINFDVRKPTLHKFFDIDNSKGVTSYLSGEHSIDEIILSTEFANLDIIPSGLIPSDPAELMMSKKLPALFKQLKKQYEYIIIDTAPIGIISDTKMLMQHSDLNLIIIREDYAKKEFIVTLEEMIEKHDFKNIGLILNASKAMGGEYGYGYSYEYK